MQNTRQLTSCGPLDVNGRLADRSYNHDEIAIRTAEIKFLWPGLCYGLPICVGEPRLKICHCRLIPIKLGRSVADTLGCDLTSPGQTLPFHAFHRGSSGDLRLDCPIFCTVEC